MFGQQPARTELDYAKWMLKYPPVNFAVSTRGDQPGVDHLGIQVESAGELAALKAQRAQATAQASACCAASGRPLAIPVTGTPATQPCC